MIHLIITGARKRQNKDGKLPYQFGGKNWWVLHPSNDSILAYCDTEAEADEVINYLDSFKGKGE